MYEYKREMKNFVLVILRNEVTKNLIINGGTRK